MSETDEIDRDGGPERSVSGLVGGLTVASLAAGGCEGEAIVAGNLASMVVAAVLFWSTLQMRT